MRKQVHEQITSPSENKQVREHVCPGKGLVVEKRICPGRQGQRNGTWENHRFV